MGRQRQLHQNTMHLRIGIQSVNEGNQFILRC